MLAVVLWLLVRRQKESNLQIGRVVSMLRLNDSWFNQRWSVEPLSCWSNYNRSSDHVFLTSICRERGKYISIDVILEDFSLQLVIITDYEDHRQTSIIFTYVFLVWCSNTVKTKLTLHHKYLLFSYLIMPLGCASWPRTYTTSHSQ